ncbi:MAG: S-layer homology domain-containing protein [Bacillota bacterium]
MKRLLKTVAVLALVLVFLVGASGSALAGGKKFFRDEDQASWAKAYLAAASLRGLLKGDPDGRFRPNDPLKREELVAALVRFVSLEEAAGSVTQAALPFRDSVQVLGKAAWARGYFAAAHDAGMLPEEGDQFLPGEAADRLWAAELLVRALGLQNEAELRAGEGVGFSDVDDVPPEKLGYLAVAVERGLLQGFPDGTFRPKEKLTRAQLAALLERSALHRKQLGKYEVRGTVAEVVNGEKREIALHVDELRKDLRRYPVSPDALVLVEAREAFLADVKPGFRACLVLNAEGTAVVVSARSAEPEKKGVVCAAGGSVRGYLGPGKRAADAATPARGGLEPVGIVPRRGCRGRGVWVVVRESGSPQAWRHDGRRIRGADRDRVGRSFGGRHCGCLAAGKGLMGVVERRTGALFDLDGTLYDLAQPMRLALQQIAPPGMCDVIEGKFWSCYFSRENSQPEDVDQFVGVLLEAAVGIPGWREKGAQLMELFLSRVAPHQGVLEFLRELASRCVPVGIVTNGPLVFQMAKIERLGLGAWFTRGNVFTPGDRLQPKPWPGIFTHACDKLGLDPRKSVFVGDNPYTDSGAVDAGMITVLVEPENPGSASLQRPPLRGDVQLERRLCSPRLHRVRRFEEAARFIRWVVLE